MVYIHMPSVTLLHFILLSVFSCLYFNIFIAIPQKNSFRGGISLSFTMYSLRRSPSSRPAIIFFQLFRMQRMAHHSFYHLFSKFCISYGGRVYQPLVQQNCTGVIQKFDESGKVCAKTTTNYNLGTKYHSGN